MFFYPLKPPHHAEEGEDLKLVVETHVKQELAYEISLNIPEDCMIDKRFLNIEETQMLQDKVVLLASVPGSGNTFTRLMLESATRIHTGSIYNDKTLSNVLKGEPYQKQEIFVKTHFPCRGCHWKRMKKSFASFTDTDQFPEELTIGNIFVLRHPFKAFAAEFQRNQTSWRKRLASKNTNLGNEHSVSLDLYEMRTMFNEKLISFLNTTWIFAYDYYNNRNDTLVVYFEDLISWRSLEISKIASFVNKLYGIEVFNTDKVMECAELPVQDGDAFRRKKSNSSLPFERESIELGCNIVRDRWNEEKWGSCLNFLLQST